MGWRDPPDGDLRRITGPCPATVPRRDTPRRRRIVDRLLTQLAIARAEVFREGAVLRGEMEKCRFGRPLLPSLVEARFTFALDETQRVQQADRCLDDFELATWRDAIPKVGKRRPFGEVLQEAGGLNRDRDAFARLPVETDRVGPGPIDHEAGNTTIAMGGLHQLTALCFIVLIHSANSYCYSSSYSQL